MKKILFAVIVICVPIFTILGGFHYFGFVRKQAAIENVMSKTDNAYYKGIASVCYKKNAWQYPCCVASVQTMIEQDAFVANDGKCNDTVAQSLQCDGSYQWCVPGVKKESNNADKRACDRDADCVAATCCHPTDVVNRAYTPQCANVMCTMSCETDLDCGRGVPVCRNGVCAVSVSAQM